MSTVNQTTRLIQSDSGVYPIFLSDMPKYLPRTCFGPTVDSDILIEFGFEVVNHTTPPEGDVVTEGAPELRNGDWHQTWVVRSYNDVEANGNLQERKTMLLAQAESLRITSFTKGFPFMFPNDQVYHVQVRTTDRGNISDMRTVAKELIAAGQDMTFEFRVFENVSVDLNAAQMVALADRTFQQVVDGYKVSWAYKTAIENATTLEDLPAAPVEFFTL